MNKYEKTQQLLDANPTRTGSQRMALQIPGSIMFC
jgi:hypothetical protein